MKIRAIAYFLGLLLLGQAMLVGGGARGQGVLPANNGVLNVGRTLAGVPVVAWYKVQQPLVGLTGTASGAGFGVALVADTGSGHGTLPAVDFTQSATINCNTCWLGVQYYAQTVGPATGSLTLSWNGSGSPETFVLQGQTTPATGVVVSPTLLNFGSVAVHSSTAPAAFVVTNLLTSMEPVTVDSVSVSGDFVLGAGVGCSGTLASTAECEVQLSFGPTATGERDGALTVVTSGGTVTATLMGTGTADSGVALNPVALNFVAQPGATATQQTVVVTNTGSSGVSVGMVSASSASFTVSSMCSTLAAGASCQVGVGFIPQGAAVAGTLSIPVTAGSTTTYSVALNGSYTAEDAGLEVVPDEVNFGAAVTGTVGGLRIVTVDNLTNKPLSLAFTMPKQFPGASVAPCATIAPMGSCSMPVEFVPVTGGPLIGTIMVAGTPADGSAAVQGLGYVQGYGTTGGVLAITGYAIPNTPVGFGQVMSGQSTQQSLTLTNKGSGVLTVRRITSTAPFLSTSSCGGTLAVGASCGVTLTYAPVYEVTTTVGAGPRTDVGTVTIESDAVRTKWR
jgi:hypothetical protein